MKFVVKLNILYLVLCIFTLVFIGVMIGLFVFPKWALILIISLGYVGWIVYKIAKNQKL